ncbi:MAG: hypothetical protein KF791_18960 [Verrucomicrobiae bacterium]|nr:hypothetical protein [Verrucomicrobiae bacterium]
MDQANRLIATVIALVFASAQTEWAAIPPLEEDRLTIDSIDFNGDGEPEINVVASRGRYPPIQENEEYYGVVVVLFPVEGSALLRFSRNRIQFSRGDSISSTNMEISGPAPLINIGGFYQWRFPGTPWEYVDPTTHNLPPAFWSSETNLLIGLKFSADDGAHYGWLQLARPNREFLTQFQVVANDWNPLPGEPIRAGLPPEIPLTSEVVPEGIRVRWPVAIGLANWFLESSDSLGPDADWVPIPEAANGEILLEPPESMRFYRLRRP